MPLLQIVDRLLDNQPTTANAGPVTGLIPFAPLWGYDGYLPEGQGKPATPTHYRYRRYTGIEGFQTNNRFDQFIIEQIAAGPLELKGEQRQCARSDGRFLTVADAVHESTNKILSYDRI